MNRPHAGLGKESDDSRLFVVSINAVDPPEQSDTALGFALIHGRSNHAAAVYPRIVDTNGA